MMAPLSQVGNKILLPWCLLSLLVSLPSLSFCEVRFVSCSIMWESPVPGSLCAVLTCDFGLGFETKHPSDLVVNEYRNIDMEILVRCIWQEPNCYDCTVRDNLTSLYDSCTTTTTTANTVITTNTATSKSTMISSDNSSSSNSTNSNSSSECYSPRRSRFLTVKLPPASAEEIENNLYICHVTGQLIAPQYCTYPKSLKTTTYKPLMESVLLESNHITGDSIEFTWNCSDNSLLGIEVTYYRGNETDGHKLQLGPGNTTFRVSGLLCGNLYRFVTIAYYSSGASNSTDVEISTTGSVPFMKDPKQLVGEINMTTVTVDFTGWKTAGCPITFFSVKYRHIREADWTILSNNISSERESMAIPELHSATPYSLAVTAYSEAGETSYTVNFSTLSREGKAVGSSNSKTSLTAVIIVLVVMLLLVIVAVVCFLWARSGRPRSRGTQTKPLTADTEM